MPPYSFLLLLGVNKRSLVYGITLISKLLKGSTKRLTGDFKLKLFNDPRKGHLTPSLALLY